MLRLMSMRAVLLVVTMCALSACQASPGPLAVEQPLQPSASASATPQRYIAEAEKGCAPNDAPAVVGRLQQDVPGGTLDLTGSGGLALGDTDVPPSGEGFVLRIRTGGSTEPLEGTGVLRLRNREGVVLEEREVPLQQSGGFSLCG